MAKSHITILCLKSCVTVCLHWEISRQFGLNTPRFSFFFFLVLCSANKEAENLSPPQIALCLCVSPNGSSSSSSITGLLLVDWVNKAHLRRHRRTDGPYKITSIKGVHTGIRHTSHVLYLNVYSWVQKSAHYRMEHMFVLLFLCSPMPCTTQTLQFWSTKQCHVITSRTSTVHQYKMVKCILWEVRFRICLCFDHQYEQTVWKHPTYA